MIVNNFFNIITYLLKFVFNLFLYKNNNIQNKISKFRPFYINYFFKKNKASFFLNEYFYINENKLFIINFLSNNNKNTKVNSFNGIEYKGLNNMKLIDNFVSNLYFKSFFFKKTNKKHIININTNISVRKIYQVISYIQFFFEKNFNKINILFLRKFRVFNKGRYSRNRQFYRTGVYWCLYINIIAVIGFYFWFYKITFNYNYFWIILYLFFLSFIWSRVLNFFSISNFYSFLTWNVSFFSCIIFNIKNKVTKILKIFKTLFFIF